MATTFEKVTLLGPAPDGGSVTYPLTTPDFIEAVENAKAAGWTESRRWTVFDTEDGPFTVEARIVDARDGFKVEVHWDHPSGLDRPKTYSILVGSKKLAERLARAIEAGVVVTNPSLATDIDGNTFVACDHNVMGRTLDADLKGLGF